MKKMIEQVAKWLDVRTNLKGIEITGVSINTRTLQKGDLFVPFRGEKVNGHKYVRQAIEAGAAAALWQRDEPSPPEDLPLLIVDDCQKALQEMARAYRDELSTTVIGITGSNGKTSTKDLVASVLKPYFKVQKTQGNFNNELGLPLTILSLDEDTKFAVLEMGMSGFGRLNSCQNWPVRTMRSSRTSVKHICRILVREKASQGRNSKLQLVWKHTANCSMTVMNRC